MTSSSHRAPEEKLPVYLFLIIITTMEKISVLVNSLIEIVQRF